MTDLLLIAKDPELKKEVRAALEQVAARIVKESSTPKETSEAFAENPVRLVIVDMFLPHTSGLEMMKMLRKMNEEVQFILITRLRNRAAMDRAFRLGAADVLVYPFSRDSFRQTVMHRMEQLGVEQLTIA